MLSNKKGFSLGEALASVIALGIISMTVQSLLLVSNSFLETQKTSFSALEERTALNHLVCYNLQHPIFVSSNPARSFSFSDSGTPTYKKHTDDLPKATLSVPLIGDEQKSTTGEIDTDKFEITKHGAVKTFLGNLPKQTEVGKTGEEQFPFKVHIEDNASNFDDLDGVSGDHNYHALFYDIYADSHTLVSFQPNLKAENRISYLGVIDQEGSIFATRCIKNNTNSTNVGEFIELTGDSPKHSIVDNFDKDGFTLDSQENPEAKEIMASALYVLEQKWRPFYFHKETAQRDKIKCCDITTASGTFTNTTTTDCKDLEKYTPITYVISIKTEVIGDNKNKIELGKDSLAGFTQNKVDDNDSDSTNINQNLEHFLVNIKNEDSELNCKTSNKFKLSGDCKDAAENLYYNELSKKFTYPVRFTSIMELPLVRKNRLSTWAHTFVGPYQGNTVNLKLLHVENRCHSILPQHVCAEAIPGENLTGTNNEVNGKSASDYFVTTASPCTFTYPTLESNSLYIPLGYETN